MAGHDALCHRCNRVGPPGTGLSALPELAPSRTNGLLPRSQEHNSAHRGNQTRVTINFARLACWRYDLQNFGRCHLENLDPIAVLLLATAILAGCATAYIHFQKLEQRIKESDSRVQAIQADFDTRQSDQAIQAIRHLEQLQIAASVWRDAETRLRECQEQLAKQAVLDAREASFARLVKEGKQAFPWIAEAIADQYEQVGSEIADRLRAKARAAPKSKEQIKVFAAELRAVKRAERIATYRLEYLIRQIPKLEEVLENETPIVTDVDDEQEPLVEVARRWVNEEEWFGMPEPQRYQLALDRYQARKKTDWQIGREYERYVGYLYEIDGFDVEYHGAIKGLADLGRDLIATRDGEVHIVQCKCWSQKKEIREQAIYFLFGTTIESYLDSPQIQLFDEITTILRRVRPVLYTTTKLSERARHAANILGVIVETHPLEREWPQIKCNINPASNERIFHLPFDQQYDRVKIRPAAGEMFVTTVQDAIQAGFRRAKRWQFSKVQ